jgi:WD40 repeat protein
VPRSERQLDDEGALAGFAADLRRLREEAGTPPYRQLARQAHYSSTTLADAAGGRRLPSLAVTLAYVRACGGCPAEWDARWHELAAELTAAGSDPTGTLAADGVRQCPYVGLAAFQMEDAERFFGRERLTEDLVARVRARRFLAVFGASGSGKSSLLRAGLLPRVRGDWSTLLFTPGAHPLEEYAARRKGLATRSEDAELLLVVDQFEEVFTLCSDQRERARFITALLTAAHAPDSRTRVVLGVRADFYARCSEYPDLVDALRDAQLLVGPMSTDELRRAISQPAVDVECTVESALLARVVADATGQANVLPLISHALRETWRRRRGNTLTLAGYEASGGIQHALARTAEAVYTGLTAERQRLTRGIFLRLVALGEGTDDTKRRVTRDELPADADTVLNTLANARLVTLDTGTVEITHEALLHAWPRLHGWITEDRASLLVHQQLVDAATTWHREHRDPGTLYRGSRLAAATEWARHHRDDLRHDERLQEFLTASTRRQHRTTMLGRIAAALLLVSALVASGTAWYAFAQRDAATAARDRTVAMQTATEADQLRGTDVSLSAQLNIAAYRMHPSPDIYTRLLGTENVALSTPLRDEPSIVYGVAFSPDRRVLATAGDDNKVRLQNVSDPAHPTPWGPPLAGHTDKVYWVSFSPDGRTLATASRDRTIRLWNVADPAHATPLGQPLIGHTSYVFSVSFSPDGRTLVSAGYDHTVRLWNVADPAHAVALGQPLTGHSDAVSSAVFSPDGRTVASAGHDHTVRLWNVTDPGHPTLWRPPLAGHTDTVYASAFSPDGRTLATVSNDHTVRLWNVADPANVVPLGQPLTGHTNTIYAVAFSPDGHTLATSGADQTVRLWNVTDPTNVVPLGQPLVGHTGYVYWLAFSPDGNTLASAGADHMVRLWNIPRTVLIGHASYVNDVAFSPDGRTLASAGSDGTVRLWNVSDPARPTASGPALVGHTNAVVQVAFSPDGRTLASASRDATVRLWNVSDPARPTASGPALVGHTGAVATAVFSPDGHTLATAGADGTVRLWNVTDPAHVPPSGRPLVGHTGYVHWLAFSPDGATLASASADDTVRLWNVSDPAHAVPLGRPLAGNTGGVHGVAFSPDGRTLATACDDHTVRLWNVSDPAHAAPLGQPLTGHTNFVYRVVFSPDGRTLASSGEDHTIRLWNVADPARPSAAGSALVGHTGAIDGAAFSPDGRTLATASDDHTVQLSGMDVDQAIQRICATTAGTLDPQRWRQYIPEAAFAPPCP